MLGITTLTLIILGGIERDFSFIDKPFDWFSWRLVFILMMTVGALLTHYLVNAMIKK